MLEQAIVDAAALRDAAIQSAEQAVVEKFSGQIKETVEQLLEQDDTSLAMPDLGMTAEEGTAEEVSFGGTDPGAEEDVDAQNKIEDQLQEIDKVGKGFAFADGVWSDLDDDEVIEIDLEKIVAEVKDLADLDEAEKNEELELAEEELSEIVKMHYKPVGHGHMGMPSERNMEEMLATVLAAQFEEYNAEVEEKNKKLKKENKSLKTNTKQLKERTKKLTDLVKFIKEQFEKAQLMNTKLLYTNRVLVDASLNERQKNDIVESINKVENIDQAKIVFETLLGTVGNTSHGKPESLSEVVGKRSSSSILLKSRQKPENKFKEEKFANRMKELAGLK